MNTEQTPTNADGLGLEDTSIPQSYYQDALRVLQDPRKCMTARQRREYRTLLERDVTPAKARANQFYSRKQKRTDQHLLVYLEKRSLRFLARQQAKLSRLLAARDRLLAELGGKDSMAARLVARDGKVWEAQLALVQGLVKKRTSGPAVRDARPKRVQRMAKVG